MPSNEPIQRVRIYLNERDTAEGQPLYEAAMERLRREGATGATATRGIAGFGPGHRLRTSGPNALTTAPVVIEWVDRAERVSRILPTLDDLLPEALITVEDLAVYRAALRSGGPFGYLTVGQVMEREFAAATRDMLVRGAAGLMLAHGQRLLPVLDERGALAGVFSDGDLARRTGLPLPLRMFPALTEDERRILLDRLPPRTLADALTPEPRTIYVESSIAQALSPLVEWGLEALPVIDRDGRVAGLFGIEQALQAARRRPAEGEAPAQGGAVRDAEPPTPVGLVMQRAVPTIPATAPLGDTIAQLLAAPERFLVVVDAGRPLGTLSDFALAQRLEEPFRSALLGALRGPDGAPAQLPDADGAPTPGALADTTAPTIAARAAQEDAIAAMLEGGFERMVVVDDDGKLAGLVARRGLVRALAQVSAR
jgi:CBS-domain-containing membrane protein